LLQVGPLQRNRAAETRESVQRSAPGGEHDAAQKQLLALFARPRDENPLEQHVLVVMRDTALQLGLLQRDRLELRRGY
jgi:hypothetical protein